ncbi:hypothetical protein K492DRAFT_240900 [Lichtheimia hyalospora FSU 10163]|nr:hypothetical protein K492DRAFT_240900 [Lichtheimia hyalospora FSU 10163]
MASIPQRNQTFRLILDEPVTYLGDTSGISMVRGEVIVNFEQYTRVHGPIQLVFAGTQTIYPWKELMQKSSKPIKTNLHRIELSLAPPNVQGMMPPGVQRFPFEFPIPGYLPTTLSIPGRLDIGYTVTATLRRSPLSGSDYHASSWLDWASFNNKSTLAASVCLQVVRAIESMPSLLGVSFLQQQQQQQELLLPSNEQVASSSSSSSNQQRMALDRYFDLTGREGTGNLLMGDEYNTHRPASLSLDEQHDQLAYSMAGRSINNWNKPIKENEAGVRYELGIDRTAIAIGTSLGVHVHLEPQQQDIKIRSITARIAEKRDYAIKVPSNNSSKRSTTDRLCKDNETLTMILKWAYGYPCEDSPRNSSSSDCDDSDNKDKGKIAMQAAKQAITALSGKYRHPCSGNHQDENDTPTETQQVQLSEKASFYSDVLERYPLSSSSQPTQSDNLTQGELLNLKFLNEKVHVGEYFDGWFVMPVPSCEHFLRPTMAHSSITISHWLYLDVVLDCSNDKKTRRITLETPIRLLDCRLTKGAAGDYNGDRQMILPPPPTYEEALCRSRDKMNKDRNDQGTAATNTDHFWVQRWPITQDSAWGTTCSTQCPCNTRKNSKTTKQQGIQSSQQTPTRWRPEWGAPPKYTR